MELLIQVRGCSWGILCHAQQELDGFFSFLLFQALLNSSTHSKSSSCKGQCYLTHFGQGESCRTCLPLHQGLVWIKPSREDGHQLSLWAPTQQHNTPGNVPAHQTSLGTGRDGTGDSSSPQCGGISVHWALPCVCWDLPRLQAQASLPLQTGRRRRRRRAGRGGHAL